MGSPLLDALVALFTTGDDTFLGLLAPELRDAWEADRDALTASFGDRSCSVESVTVAGDQVLVSLVVDGTHTGSGYPWLDGAPVTGRRVSWPQLHRFRVVDGVVVEHWSLRDDQAVIDAVGDAA